MWAFISNPNRLAVSLHPYSHSSLRNPWCPFAEEPSLTTSLPCKINTGLAAFSIKANGAQTWRSVNDKSPHNSWQASRVSQGTTPLPDTLQSITVMSDVWEDRGNDSWETTLLSLSFCSGHLEIRSYLSRWREDKEAFPKGTKMGTQPRISDCFKESELNEGKAGTV